MTYHPGESVILVQCGPADDGIGRVALVDRVSSVAWCEGRRFDVNDGWDIPLNPASVIRHVLKRNTPENRRRYGLAKHLPEPATAQ